MTSSTETGTTRCIPDCTEILQRLFRYEPLAFSAKPPSPACGDQPVTVIVVDDPGGNTPGLCGDGQPYANGNGVTANRNNCPGSGDTTVALAGSARYFVVRFGAPLAKVGTVPNWVQNGAPFATQGTFTIRRFAESDTSNGMMIYFKGPDRKSYAFQFSNPRISSPPGGLGGDPILVNNPLLTSKIWAGYSISGSTTTWDVAADAAAETCSVDAGDLSNSAGQAPVGTLPVGTLMVQSGALYVNVAEFTLPIRMTVTKP